MKSAENLCDGCGRGYGAVVEFNSAAEGEETDASGEIALPNDGECGLRAVEGVEFNESIANEREGARGVPVRGGSRVGGEIKGFGSGLEEDAEGSSVVRTSGSGGGGGEGREQEG
jgi:hypothetical protein